MNSEGITEGGFPGGGLREVKQSKAQRFEVVLHS